jgi:hypothetical protein
MPQRRGAAQNRRGDTREILRVTENDPAYASARFGRFAELVLLPGIVLMLLIVLIRRGAGGCM